MQLIQSLDVLEKKIISGKAKGLEGALQIGIALEKIKENNMYLAAGSKTFEQYVENTHGFSRSSAYNFINVARYFGPLLLADPSLQTVDPSRLVKLLPLITEVNKEELLHSAAQMPDARGFDNLIRSLQKKVCTDDPHEHDFVPINIEQCSVCGLRRKVKV